MMTTTYEDANDNDLDWDDSEYAAPESPDPPAADTQPSTGFSLFGENLFGEPVVRVSGVLADRFTVPPFSVLNSAGGDWQDRKRAWLAYGIKGEEGRGKDLAYNIGKNAQVTVEPDGTLSYLEPEGSSGTSVFDPVLCELMYKWFSPRGGLALDPFAGGSVRGIVAGMLGRRYHGVELRSEQVDANRLQGDQIAPPVMPAWTCGDSMEVLDGDDHDQTDFIFSCPPYADLERYSDDPRDLSTMEYHTFIAAMKRIVLRSCRTLRNDRFAVFVVGDIRDKKGYYRGFTVDTINAFREQGLRLYNHGILTTPVGTLALRTGKQFVASRKLGKRHQDVLVFVKGDPRVATRTIIEAEGADD